MNLGKFTKSKIVSDNVMIAGKSSIGIGKHGNNTDMWNVSFKSGTKGAQNPTEGGNSMSGPSGSPQLNGAQGN